MSELDRDAHCSIHTNDEFGELSHSLNQMFANLQDALKKLESTNLQLAEANTQLKKDVDLKHVLLEERKELTDALSHEMKTPLGIIRAYTEGPVSYTHLDVYKRQGMHRAPLWVLSGSRYLRYRWFHHRTNKSFPSPFGCGQNYRNPFPPFPRLPPGVLPSDG